MAASSHISALPGKRLLLGVTGGIAAYKSAELLRLFKRSGAEVQVLMTPDAGRFITPLTLGTLSEREVLIDVFPDNEDGSWTRHITLGHWADLFVIAPATAQTIAKLAHGFSDNMLTATALAAQCPVLVCPAMDHDMLVHPATKTNLERLASFGYDIMPPDHGELASGLVGEGRLPEPSNIFRRVVQSIAESTDLDGMRVLVTAGPTREFIDPVRFISNPSSGKMGFALADVAVRRGASVTLITGPSQLNTPHGVERIEVVSAAEMHDAVMKRQDADVVLMAAAVADYKPIEQAEHKTKKTDGDTSLSLTRTRDILAELGGKKRDRQILVGFAMETQNGVESAAAKLETKNLDWIVLNHVNMQGSGFDVDTNQVTILRRDGSREDLPLMSKREVAASILDRVQRSIS